MKRSSSSSSSSSSDSSSSSCDSCDSRNAKVQDQALDRMLFYNGNQPMTICRPPPQMRSVTPEFNYSDVEDSSSCSNSNKHAKVECDDSSSSSSCASASSVVVEDPSSCASASLDEDEVAEFFVPKTEFELSSTEKQIISKTFSLISRSTISDWVHEPKPCVFDQMNLTEFIIVVDDKTTHAGPLCVKFLYHPKLMVANVTCELVGHAGYAFSLSWLPEGVGGLSISKDVRETSWLMFSKTTTKCNVVMPEDTREDNWCYFDDARRHIDRICFRD